jgi:hypothetical protein
MAIGKAAAVQEVAAEAEARTPTRRKALRERFEAVCTAYLPEHRFEDQD